MLSERNTIFRNIKNKQNEKTNILLVLLLFTPLIRASVQYDTTIVETKITLQTKNGEIVGILMTPKNFENISVALIIAGSGPTDREGNGSKKERK